MSGETAANDQDKGKAKEEADTRQRSSIAFPYDDLESAAQIAEAIHNNVGMGDCDDDQLSVWTSQSSKSSGYRTQLSAARMFGLIETMNSRHKLTDLGRQVIDPARRRESRANAFMKVPLFSAVYAKYKGGMLPPAAAFERDLTSLGVAEKMKDRARRVLERSADQAGFCEQGKNRLVMPGFAVREQMNDTPPPDDDTDDDSGKNKRKGGSGGGGSDLNLHPFIQGLLQTLPEQGTEWKAADRAKWLQTAANIFDLIYKGDGGVRVEAAMAARSPRPES